ncbi:MAG: hypothetical protein JWO05_3921 [Gemmatimonadetes bacterium]|nr:hypothetical protein [Gemmatimonadota bacterium]
MPELYAQSFDLSSPPACDAAAEVSNALRDWIGDRWPTSKGWFSTTEPGSIRSADGSIFRWEPFVDQQRQLIDFTWRHPHANDRAISWSTRVTFAVLPSRTYVSIRVSNTGPALGHPGCLPTTRPRLLISLAERFTLFERGVRVSMAPLPLSETDIASFVRYELYDPKRRYPIALLSPDAHGNFVLDPLQFGRDLLGLAKTYVAMTPESTFALTDELGRRELSCFQGALRIYFPEFTRSADPFRHPLLLPRRLAISRERLRLAQALSALTIRRFDEEPSITVLRDERAIALEAKREVLVVELASAHAAAKARQDYEHLADLYSRENETLQREVESLHEQLQELSHKVAGLQFALSRQSEGSMEPLEDEFEFEPEDVLDSVEQAAALYGAHLLVLATAGESAQQSPFARPREVLNALRMLSEVAALVNEVALGRPLREEFAARGLDYRGGIARTTSKKLRRQYLFTDGEFEYPCEEHLCLGSGSYDPADCLRIYINTKLRPGGRFVVGHVGRHLDVISTS